MENNTVIVPPEPVIAFDQVYKVFQKDWMALYDVSLRISRGEMVFLFGASGAGKTTLLSLVSMMQHPTQGAVSVLGHRSGRMKARHLPRLRRRLGVVFQDFKLLQDRTVYENIAFVLHLTGVPGRNIRTRVPEMLARMGLETQAAKFPYQLSGGERQKVAIARALINEPEIILADEPTGNIGEDQALEILRYIREINERGTTVMVATHNRRLVTGLRCRTIVLDKGRVKEDILPSGGDGGSGNVQAAAPEPETGA